MGCAAWRWQALSFGVNAALLARQRGGGGEWLLLQKGRSRGASHVKCALWRNRKGHRVAVPLSAENSAQCARASLLPRPASPTAVQGLAIPRLWRGQIRSGDEFI